MMTCTKPIEAAPEQHEDRVLPEVRSALESLPILDRQLLALHFGGGLTPVEIGNALALPHATIQQLLRTAAASMRTCLKYRGIAELVSDDMMRRAVTSGLPAPTGLYEKVQQRLSAALCRNGILRREIGLAGRFAILLAVYIACIQQH